MNVIGSCGLPMCRAPARITRSTRCPPGQADADKPEAEQALAAALSEYFAAATKADEQPMAGLAELNAHANPEADMKPKKVSATPAPKRTARGRARQGQNPKALKMPAALVGLDIVTALRDPNLLGFGIKDPSTYQAWISTAKAAFGLRMNKAELALLHNARNGPTRQPNNSNASCLYAGADRERASCRRPLPFGSRSFAITLNTYRKAKRPRSL